MRLSLYRFDTGVETIGGNRVVYDLERETRVFRRRYRRRAGARLAARPGRRRGGGRAVSRSCSSTRSAHWVARCDRIDFPLGGMAYRHTHPGPRDPVPAARRARDRDRGALDVLRPRRRVVRERPGAGRRTCLGASRDLVRAGPPPARGVGGQANDSVRRRAGGHGPEASPRSVHLEHPILVP